MSRIKLVISDLHLGDGHPILEGTSSDASLCSWDGGAKGSYRVLV